MRRRQDRSAEIHFKSDNIRALPIPKSPFFAGADDPFQRFSATRVAARRLQF
jgi:hypothetical protein